MFVVYVGAVLTSALWLLSFAGIRDENPGYTFAIALILWFTVLFANFAEAIAEGRGRAQADTLRKSRKDVKTKKLKSVYSIDDYDEVLFYHAGDFFSRDNIHPGMMTFHPTGFTHGPHPKALARMFEQPKPATDEYAVMIDTRDPLDVADAATQVEWTDYRNSWKPKAP
mgnify:CR=1 FL=1